MSKLVYAHAHVCVGNKKAMRETRTFSEAPHDAEDVQSCADTTRSERSESVESSSPNKDNRSIRYIGHVRHIVRNHRGPFAFADPLQQKSDLNTSLKAKFAAYPKGVSTAFVPPDQMELVS